MVTEASAQVSKEDRKGISLYAWKLEEKRKIVEC